MPKIAAGCELTEAQLVPCLSNLKEFLEPFMASLVRTEQRRAFEVYVRGRLSNLERRTLEPIATAAGLPRRPIQRFVGAGPWSDAPVLGELRAQVVERLGSDEAVISIDPSGFPKKGDDSVGVTRQWCGRLGKVESCQKGIFVSYASAKGFALVDFALYLPEDWAEDPARRAKCHVPADVVFQTCTDMAERQVLAARSMPHGWIAGDDEYGRDSKLRRILRFHRERYVLDVPSNTRVLPRVSKVADALVGGLRPAAAPTAPEKPLTAKQWADTLDRRTWARFVVREGQKGPLRVRAACVPVLTRPSDQCEFTEKERLVVIETLGRKRERRYCLAHAADATPLETLVRVAASRHHIEEALETAKGDAGLAHYEVRSWVGWHHHMTLSLVAAWFLALERKRLGGKNTRHHRLANAPSRSAPAPKSSPVDPGGRASRHDATRPQRGVAPGPLAFRSEGPAATWGVEGAVA